MTDAKMTLLELVEQEADTDLVREMLAFAAERMMDLERLCCITYWTCNHAFTLGCYAMRAVIGVAIAEKRLRIAARTLSSLI